jgi:TolA-binding protein
MKDVWFLVYCQILTVGIVAGFGFFKAHFAQDPALPIRISHLREEVKVERLKTQLALEDLEEFKAFVATQLPEALKKRGKKQSGYGVRTLASLTTSSPNPILLQAMSVSQFEKAQKLFQAKNYAETKKVLTEFIEQHPYSPKIIDAHFLLMEALDQLGEVEASTRVIEKMVHQYPDSELSGFALVKLGRYLERQGRNLDASEIYKTVLQTYPFGDVAAAASRSLRSLEQ